VPNRYRPKSYPFWPAKVVKLTRNKKSQGTKITVMFFGDGAKDVVVTPEANLR
jgi:hypothetical protein